MHITPDEVVYFKYGFIELNNTIVTTWLIMLFLVVVSLIVRRKITSDLKRSRLKNILEIIVLTINKQIKEIGIEDTGRYLGFIGTLFLFLATASICTMIPGYESPTGSLSTTLALALCVFISVPFYGISERGLKSYLKSYIEPTIIMLPFNIISEFSRTLAMAIRLFGNMMSGTMIIGILLSIAPLFVPIFLTVLGLLTGLVQAYIFSILTAVYIAAAVQISNKN